MIVQSGPEQPEVPTWAVMLIIVGAVLIVCAVSLSAMLTI